jgi:hypothetical protein
MWGVEGSGMVLLPNMVTDFRDRSCIKIVGARQPPLSKGQPVLPCGDGRGIFHI